MRQLLSKLEEERWDWISEGIRDFREGFLRLPSPETGKKEVLVGIYGPTQVGKTTLILKILGIRENKIGKLSKALRGGREMGNSATVTATVYHRSPDANFSIIYPNDEKKVLSTIKEFEEEMGNIRDAVERANTYTTKPIHIAFSENYFDMNEVDARIRDITILDLPGDDSREEREIKHVQRCLREYLPQCRLCLIMEIGSQMVNLTQITQEYVQDWSYLPEQFRIVLTRTLTSSSVRGKINNKTIYSASSYIEHFKYELNRLMNESRKVNRIYPLELGDSWQGIQEKFPDFYETVHPWLNDVYQQLLADLQSVESPEREVLKLLSLEDLANKNKQEEVSKIDTEIKLCKEILDDIEISIKSKNIQISQINSDINQLNELILNIGKLQFDLPKKPYVASWEDRNSSKKNVSSLKGDFLCSLDQLERDFNRSIRTWNKKMSLFAADEYFFDFSPIPNINVVQTIFIDRLFDRYFTRTSFIEDYQSGYATLNWEFKKADDYTLFECNKKVEELTWQVENLIRAKRVMKEEFKKDLKELEKKNKDKKKSLKVLNKLLLKTHKEWNHDIERTNELYQYLKKSFVEKMGYFKKRIESEETSTETKWAYHLYWNIIMKDAERIFKHENDR